MFFQRFKVCFLTTILFFVVSGGLFLNKSYADTVTDTCPDCNCEESTTTTSSSPTTTTTTLPPCPSGRHYVSGVSGNGCCQDGFNYAVNGQCSRCPEGQTYTSGSCKQKCYKVNFYGYATNHDPDETIASTFDRTNSACGITLMEQVSSAMLPPGRNTVDSSGDIHTGGGGYPDGRHTRYEKVADMFTNSLWLLLVQKARGVCTDTPFPSENIWTPDTSGGYYHLDANSSNYQPYKQWFDCMHAYATALDPATNSYKNYNDNLNDYVTCYAKAYLSHSENTGFGGDGTSGRKRATFDACQYGNITLDGNCNMLQKSDINNTCGSTSDISFTFESDTPISLVLDQSYDINSNFSLVQFSLSQSTSNKFWVWRGSASAPLLVYDPQHKGQITSAQQLFGSWTFGGKRLASKLNISQKPQPWGNGFEALATLDINGDNKISGEELAPLALWFDENQDAVTQEGEVKLLSEVGIKELYFNPDSEDKLNKTIEVRKGFVREVNGKIVSGKAVDWSAEGSDSQFDLYSKMILMNSSKSEKLKSNALPSAIDDSTAKNNPQDLTAVEGLWYWKLSGEESRGKPGFFILGLDVNNKIKGHSFAENHFSIEKNNIGQVVSTLNFSAISGNVKAEKNGKFNVNFKTTISEGEISNQATISADGKSMSGTSVATYVVDGVTKTYKYSWTAKKKTKFVQ